MMKTKVERGLVIAGVAAMSMSTQCTIALAQGGAAEARSAGLEEIIVTARRKEENAQSVPVSISALSAETLKLHSVDSLEDLTRLTPGLRFAAEGGGQNTTVSLRGLSKIPIGDGTPAVVTYFANVPLANDGSNLPTFDLANIQILKGPQGTLFGRNTIGGAVLVSPREPTYETQGYIKAGAGNYSSRTAEGAANLPLVDEKLALRVAGQLRRRDGFAENIGPGPDLDDVHQHSLRASLLWDPTSSISNTLIGDYFQAHEAPSNVIFFRYTPGALTNFGGPAAAPIFGPFESALAQSFAEQQARGLRKLNADSPVLVQNREIWGIANNTTFKLSDRFTLRNIFGYRSTQVDVMGDTDAGPLLVADSTALPLAFLPGLAGVPGTLDRLRLLNAGQIVNKKQLTNELQLLGTSFDNRVNWIVGGFYLKDEPNGKQGSWFQQFEVFSSLTGISLSPAAGSTQQVTSKSYSGFGQAGIDLSGWVLDGLKLNLGYRYTKDEVSACGATIVGGTNSLNAPFLTSSQCSAYGNANPGTGAGNLSTESSAPSWTIGLDYQINDSTFVYLTSRRGYRSGGVNTPVFNTPGTTTNGPGAVDIRQFQFVEPEEVTDIEAGVKSDLNIGDVPLRINVAAFDMKYKDATQFINVLCCIATTDPGLPTRGSFGLNAADLTIRGVEFEGTVAPLENLTFTTTAAYTDQKVDKLAGVPAPFTLSANEVTLPTPEWSATFGFRWVLPAQALEGEIAFSGDYFWTDEWQAQGTPLPSYELSNFRLDWNGIKGNLDASLFVTNAFDEEYIISPSAVLSNLPFGSALYGPPRMYGLELVYHFGN